MFRRIPAFFFLILLTFLVVLKDLALGFCLCENAIFIGNDPCATQPCATPCCEIKPCDDHSSPAENPCDDCTFPLQLEVEDYLWSLDLFTTPTLRQGSAASPEFSAFHPRFSPTPTLSLRVERPPPPEGCSLLYRQQKLRL